MSNAKVKSFLPLPSISSSDDESKNSPVPMKDKAICASRIAQPSLAGSSNISPVPTRENMKAKYGKLLYPAPGRLTPTGRIKAPPCAAPALKRVASSIVEFNTAGVCFTAGEAESCAEKALLLDGKDENTKSTTTDEEEMPLNIEKCDAGFSWKSAAESMAAGASVLEWNRAPHQFVSSSSTVVTTSSASSCGRSSMGSEIAVVASLDASREPPLKVVRTDSAANAEDEHVGGGGSVSVANQAQVVSQVASKTPQPTDRAPEAPVQEASSAKPLSTAFTNNLVKENSSRQGRSLQRWLVHSPTEELVRQVAGTVPITRDGRIILVSASRKTEWILPKGGWDTDETKEECATRETFEEAGLLGRLGGCLEPIDYETRKARKRRLKMTGAAGLGSAGVKKSEGDGAGESKTGDKVEGQELEGREGLHPPRHKRAKTGEAASKSPSLDSTCRNSASADNNQVSAAHPLSTPAATTLAAAASFDPNNYSYVRLSLFPLYVSSVKSDWPEKGRLRKLVDIDEAIGIMEAENRPYFKRGLEMVKERGLHLMKTRVGGEE